MGNATSDLAEPKEQDTKNWPDHRDVETLTKEMPDGKTFWEIKLPESRIPLLGMR